MTLYRRRGVVEAIQWTGENRAEVERFFGAGCTMKEFRGGSVFTRDTTKVYLGCETKATFGIGDWITRDEKGFLATVIDAVFVNRFKLIDPLAADELLVTLDARAETLFTAGPLRDACRALVHSVRGETEAADIEPSIHDFNLVAQLKGGSTHDVSMADARKVARHVADVRARATDVRNRLCVDIDNARARIRSLEDSNGQLRMMAETATRESAEQIRELTQQRDDAWAALRNRERMDRATEAAPPETDT